MVVPKEKVATWSFLGRNMGPGSNVEVLFMMMPSLSNGVSVSDSFVWQQIAYLDPDRGRTRENKSIQSTDALMLGCIFALFLALVVLAILPFAFSA